MSWLKKTFAGAAVVGLVAAVSGCNGGVEDTSPDSGVHKAFEGPEWVNKGGVAFPEDKGKAIYRLGQHLGLYEHGSKQGGDNQVIINVISNIPEPLPLPPEFAEAVVAKQVEAVPERDETGGGKTAPTNKEVNSD